MELLKVLTITNVIVSLSEGRRYLYGGGIKVNGIVEKNTEYFVKVGDIITVGKSKLINYNDSGEFRVESLTEEVYLRKLGGK